MTIELILLIVLLFASAFFSSAELAYVISNKLKIELRARKNLFSAKNASYYVKNPQIFFSTILISNNIINTAFASLITLFLAEYYGLNNLQILLISTTLIFFFGELFPKFVSNEIPDSLLYFAVIPLRFFTFILYPFVKFTSLISSIFTGRTKLSEEGINRIFEVEDFQSLINESTEAGFVDETNSDILNKFFDLREQKVSETMTPRTDIVGIDIESSIDEALDAFIESGYSKLPVYEESLDHIKGVILAYDMFNKPKDIKSVVRDIPFIPETKRSLDTLNELLEAHLSMAVVVDEFGGTAGIVTLEDIIEEMIGEIRDEYDEEDEVKRKIDDETYLFSGKVEVDTINEEFELGIPEGEYETVAGFIITSLGRIPLKGEKITINDFIIEIMFADKTKIELVKIKKKK